MPDGDRLARVLGRLPPDDAAWLAAQLEAPWQARQRRYDRRDQAVSDAAMVICPGQAPAAAGSELARRFGAYLASGWARGESDLRELPPGTLPWRAALHRLARLNEGKSIGARQIANILSPARGRNG